MTQKRIGILAHPRRPKSFPVAESIAESLRKRDVDTWLHTRWESQDVQSDVENSDMVIAIGGDGAMLKAARVCSRFEVPVLGVNMGRLGFLTEIEKPEEWQQYIDRLLAGDYWIEKRTMLNATVYRHNEIVATGDALNDVVISGVEIGRMIQLDTYIDQHWATTYNADGLVIASATGSTAYTLALGGPILPPNLPNILIVPAAPHLSMSRPIIISEGSLVSVIPSSANKNRIQLTLDGVPLSKLRQRDQVHIRASKHISRFIRLREPSYFYRSLLDRLEPRINMYKPEEETLNKRIQGHDGS